LSRPSRDVSQIGKDSWESGVGIRRVPRNSGEMLGEIRGDLKGRKGMMTPKDTYGQIWTMEADRYTAV